MIPHRQGKCKYFCRMAHRIAGRNIGICVGRAIGRICTQKRAARASQRRQHGSFIFSMRSCGFSFYCCSA